MMVFNNIEFKIKDMKEKNKTVSTLLIPESLLENFLRKRQKKHKGNTTVYLRNLLRLYRVLTYSGMIPAPSKIKTEYQDENLNLKRLSFRPDNSDWIELGELALAFGKSRCWIFTFLLELDLNGFSKILSKFFPSQSVPTTPDLELKSSWTLQPYFHDFAHSFHVKV